MKWSVIVTCEHGGNEIPEEYLTLFTGADDVLLTHRGWDKGALIMAKSLSDALECPFFYSKTSRLLVELNRSIGHKSLFSNYTKHLEKSEKERILVNHYFPYRNRIESEIENMLAGGFSVLHVSMHSFTPVFKDFVRPTDVGFLYDPSRSNELSFCGQWRRSLKGLAEEWTLSRNKPYAGVLDGFVTAIRKRFDDSVYVGIELEVNQKFYEKGGRDWKLVNSKVVDSFLAAYKTWDSGTG